jgi:hypothetical protein
VGPNTAESLLLVPLSILILQALELPENYGVRTSGTNLPTAK